MRHRVAGRKLGRNASQRSALLRGLITELFRHDRISTTDAKARFMRGDAEHLITVAKNGLAAGGNSVHAHRLAARVITDPEVTKRLFDEIAPRFAERPGGYTRIVKVGPRVGDAAEIVVLELVEKGGPAAEAKSSKGKAARGKDAAGKAAKGAEPKGKAAKGKDTASKAKSTEPKGKAAEDAKPKGRPVRSRKPKAGE